MDDRASRIRQVRICFFRTVNVEFLTTIRTVLHRSENFTILYREPTVVVIAMFRIDPGQACSIAT